MTSVSNFIIHGKTLPCVVSFVDLHIFFINYRFCLEAVSIRVTLVNLMKTIRGCLIFLRYTILAEK